MPGTAIERRRVRLGRPHSPLERAAMGIVPVHSLTEENADPRREGKAVWEEILEAARSRDGGL